MYNPPFQQDEHLVTVVSLGKQYSENGHLSQMPRIKNSLTGIQIHPILVETALECS
jgi:hypothetical protein